MSSKAIHQFVRDEDGAVTIDWIVLTAGLIIFGMLVVSSIVSGATNVSSGVGAQLGNASVPDIHWD